MPLGIRHSDFRAWSSADRGYALAWKRNKASTCSCGTRRDEWDTDPDAYISDHVHCEGCARLAEERDNVPRDGDGKPLPGYYAFLTPRTLYRPQIGPPGRRH